MDLTPATAPPRQGGFRMTPRAMLSDARAALVADVADRIAATHPRDQMELAALRQTLAEARADIAALAAELVRLRDGQTIYLGDHEALTRLYTGHRLYVDTRDVGICSHLMLEGRWEPWIEQVLGQAVKPGMRFADVGANFGYYTILGAEWVGAEGQVFSFEANPGICRRLRKSIAVNGFDGRVRLFEVGVADREGVLDLAFTHEFSGGGSLAAGGAGRGERARVRTAPIDLLLADVPVVQVMKIDVEGMEPQALAGAAGLITRSPALTLVVEFQATAMADPAGYLDGLLAQGFTLALIEPAGLTGPLARAACLERLGSQLGYLHLSRG